MENASARNLWGDFLDAHLEFASEDAPKVIHFCDNEKDANTCASLVCKDVKRATSHSLLGLQLRKEELPKIGDFAVVTDWSGKALCIIRTTSVKLVPYFSIHSEHARLEGEGDKSLEHWQKSHWDYYTRELAKFNRTPLESMIVVFERFEKVFQK
ncbi:ASCH domain-containing protein [Flagellimonas hymeniacidonis]|uniref:ASCH domain-containing protein n=1 Tax=Flagellimonas hymeniacidonis TaxID=2603628 RepID=A0A5C8V6W7_9FLAO|nr:ASCH domain-containing protein [Flagellimonas hymeniacidonis]TXN37447.1 ASCH domain-containing protein [Flagellimonas hymeniacidonis]